MSSHPQSRRTPPASRRPASAPELVDPSFLLKALGGVFATALILAYLTLCIVYARGGWQLVLNPSRTLATTPASQGLSFEEVHFSVDSTGEPQLDGWWIPADTSKPRTVLMLHGATGNMADALPTAAILHALHLNVLLFDYRGYGRSGPQHPTEAAMQQDAHSALAYLLKARGIHPSDLVIYSHDLAASIALDLCSTTPQIEFRALLLDAPDGDTLARVAHDPRSHAVPTSLLFHDRFPLAAPLASLPAPALFIFHSNIPPPAFYRNTPNPKMALSIQPGDTASLTAGIQRFLEDNHPQQ